MANWEAKTVHDVVQQIDQEDIVLPVIQRNLVWDEDKMELLFDSLLKGNSFGGIMVVHNQKGDVPLFAFRRFAIFDDLHDSEERERLNRSIYLVIDGQQRLQALYMGLRGGFHGKSLYFNLLSEGDYEFEFAAEAKKLLGKSESEGIGFLWVLVKELYSELSRINNGVEAAQEIIRGYGINDDAQKNLILRNVTCFYREMFDSRPLGFSQVTINKGQVDSERRRMVELFRRLNDGGTRLSALELVASRLKGFDYHLEVFLRKEITPFEDIGFHQDEVVKLLFLLRDDYRKEVTDVTQVDADFAIENQTRILRTLEAVRKMLQYSGLYQYFTSGSRPTIPLYFIAYHIFHKAKKAEELPFVYDNHDTNNPDFTNLKRWLYLSLLNGVFSRGRGWIPYRTGMRKILEIVSRHKNGLFPVNELFSMYISHPLAFSQDLNTNMLNRWDMNFTFYLIYDLDVLGGRDIDHIQPRSLLEGRNIDSGLIHSIGNYQLITVDDNRNQKRAKELKVWLQSWGDVDFQPYLEKHLIPNESELWSLDQFTQLIKKRNNLIVEKVCSYIPVLASPASTVSVKVTPASIVPGTPQTTAAFFVPEALQNHPALSDTTSLRDVFLHRTSCGPRWASRYNNELVSQQLITLGDFARAVACCGLKPEYTDAWGTSYSFVHDYPSCRRPTLRTLNFGTWAWGVVLGELEKSGFTWRDFVVG